MSNIITRDGKSFYVVNTSNAVEVPAGHALITANLRETKGSVVPAEQKHRNVVIREFSLGESVPKQFQAVLLDKFYSLAKDYLEVVMEESRRMQREIPVESFSVDNLLSFFSRESLSQRITKEAVEAWFDQSRTAQKIKDKAPAQLEKYKALFAKTASPNHGINPNTCTVLMATMEPEDTEERIGKTLVERWQATVTKSQASEVEAL